MNVIESYSTKRQGWESPDRSDMDSILACHVATTSIRKQQLPSMKS